ncbi:adenosine 3'-phospho 5'-phosphosulfate transporter 1 [Aricia agestis]|uniref:adenosine 3'-phospho 5'-phosphosulfate transporter 1 n=1 Tax=Aricia agestis TaxID=91739 RepID=UPI001C209C91|nr:adenosine 3'-phospho 5'-phosphosulfate transporter 1 [Aricia agestis]
MRSRIFIVVVLLLFLSAVWFLGHLYRGLVALYEQYGALSDTEYSWIFRLMLNFVGYSTIILPAYILYKYLEKTNYFDKISTKNTWLSRVLFAVFGDQERLPDSVKAVEDESITNEGVELAFCFTGLMGAYLMWGLLQEKIMTQDYTLSDGTTVRFTDSQFLVFVNRLLACCLAVSRLLATRRPLLPAPLSRFAPAALTNVVSAWCQYEALKYVSFPTQVLSKSCKVIPVMIMGKIISRNKYELYEYVTAGAISAGMALFMMTSGAGSGSSTTTAAGAALLALYMCCDSFTSSWQAALFASHPSLRPLQMLAAVNLCSCALTAPAALNTNNPALYTPQFIFDCILLSISSAVGQLLIYRTISKFGAVVFTIIMTLRQAVSILTSCIVYGHAVSIIGAGGISLVLGAVLLRLYCRARRKQQRAKAVRT